MNALQVAAFAALSVAIALPSSAQTTGLEAAFGATIVSTHPDGRQARLWLSADHQFMARGRAGNRSSGTWRLRGGRLCLTQARPIPIPFSYCHGFPAVRPGVSWRDTASNGEPVTNRIVPGR